MTTDIVEKGYNAVGTPLAREYGAFLESETDEAFANIVNAIAALREMHDCGCLSDERYNMLQEQYSECLKALKISHHTLCTLL